MERGVPAIIMVRSAVVVVIDRRHPVVQEFLGKQAVGPKLGDIGMDD